MKDKELQVVCCFCGQGLPFDKAVEITIRIDREADEVQAVYAHPKCIDKALHQSVPRGFEID
ncbi:MAG TPA: hypothetical protein VK589_17280 [Chryseolinea sp.]|nr:hypothetical protein [Chryseolinea sp.]